MKIKLFMSLLLAVTMVTTGAGLTLAAHPEIPLYTYEEIGMQFTPGFNPADYTTAPPVVGDNYMMMSVFVNATGNGFPYSPKMTCGNCHNGTLVRWDSGPMNLGASYPGSYAPITDAAGDPITEPLVSYDDMTTQAFHAELGAQEWQDKPQALNADGTVNDAKNTESSQPGKPWSQTNGMWGKW